VGEVGVRVAPDGGSGTFRITIGGVPAAALRARLQDAGVRCNALAEQMLADPRFPTAADPFPIALVAVAVADLGFPDGAILAHIRKAAAARGFVLCPLETAPHLRLAYLEQPESAVVAAAVRHRAPPGSLTVVSPSLGEGEEAPRGFYLSRIAGEVWLRGYVAPDEHAWSPEDRIVFRRAAPPAAVTAASGD
jgi:hypothetical protein